MKVSTYIHIRRATTVLHQVHGFAAHVTRMPNLYTHEARVVTRERKCRCCCCCCLTVHCT